MVAKKNQVQSRRRLLSKLANQSRKACELRHFHSFDFELNELNYLLQISPPRARFVNYRGIKFPIFHALSYRVAACPDSGRYLIGAVDL